MKQALETDARLETQTYDLVPVPGNRNKMPKRMKTHGAKNSFFQQKNVKKMGKFTPQEHLENTLI
ncbi:MULTISPECIES: hypothetical protein [unclassified Fibrobacter]|uniref:hypothetical protein n=1 Tax=unclassified Fibrobacter TaxID=2634177 RepID=UPI0025C4EC5F|nr:MULTISPECIES: hypothetical protein [unclassified Fibrobacter]